MTSIDYKEAFIAFKSWVEDNNFEIESYKLDKCIYYLKFNNEEFILPINLFSIKGQEVIRNWIKPFKEKYDLNNLIFGKDKTERIVSIEVNDDFAEIFIEHKDTLEVKVVPNKLWMMSNKCYNHNWVALEGNLYYKYIRYYKDLKSLYIDKKNYPKEEVFSLSDTKEAFMTLYGYTYFKNMKVNEVSSLFFDIETTGLTHNKYSKVLLISNTFVKNGVISRKLFAYDEYEDEAKMLQDWANWVKDVNPSVMCGHNIFGYDLPYMAFCARKAGTSLLLGRDNSEIKFNKYTSKFRKDGSQDYEYTRCFIYGREIIDTMFVAYHFDFARKYESYGLKKIIAAEGLEVKDRQHYDASQIYKNHKNPEEWKKIKAYAQFDADDAMALYKLMISSYFYLTSYMTKSFQVVNYSATGSILNSFLIRSYLQEGHSIPKADTVEKFEGAISFGVPGIYKNCLKMDFASLYPNIIRSFKIFSKDKDPKENLLKMVGYFTEDRLKNKKLAKETGDRYYQEFEQSQKTVINSIYGLMGAPGLNFNYSHGASEVTRIGRELLKFSVLWATGKDYLHWLKLFKEKTGQDEEQVLELGEAQVEHI